MVILGGGFGGSKHVPFIIKLTPYKNVLIYQKSSDLVLNNLSYIGKCLIIFKNG